MLSHSNNDLGFDCMGIVLWWGGFAFYAPPETRHGFNKGANSKRNG